MAYKSRNVDVVETDMDSALETSTTYWMIKAWDVYISAVKNSHSAIRAGDVISLVSEDVLQILVSYGDEEGLSCSFSSGTTASMVSAKSADFVHGFHCFLDGSMVMKKRGREQTLELAHCSFNQLINLWSSREKAGKHWACFCHGLIRVLEINLYSMFNLPPTNMDPCKYKIVLESLELTMRFMLGLFEEFGRFDISGAHISLRRLSVPVLQHPIKPWDIRGTSLSDILKFESNVVAPKSSADLALCESWLDIRSCALLYVQLLDVNAALKEVELHANKSALLKNPALKILRQEVHELDKNKGKKKAIAITGVTAANCSNSLQSCAAELMSIEKQLENKNSFIDNVREEVTSLEETASGLRSVNAALLKERDRRLEVKRATEINNSWNSSRTHLDSMVRRLEELKQQIKNRPKHIQKLVDLRENWNCVSVLHSEDGFTNFDQLNRFAAEMGLAMKSIDEEELGFIKELYMCLDFPDSLNFETVLVLMHIV